MHYKEEYKSRGKKEFYAFFVIPIKIPPLKKIFHPDLSQKEGILYNSLLFQITVTAFDVSLL